MSHNFNINQIKTEIDKKFGIRRKPPEHTYMGEKDTYLYF
jgi:hypothetical protein